MRHDATIEAQVGAGERPSRPNGLLVATVILRRELIRFGRQPARIVAAVGTPCVLWLFLAAGFAESLRPQHLDDASYAAFLLPGMMTLVAVFAAIFSSISVIEDRNEGWLWAVLASPAPRWSIALGRIAGGSLVAWTQAALLIAISPALGIHLTPDSAGVALAALAATSVAATAVGLAFAWRIETTGGFHAVMNLVFMPLWLLSGAIFPVEGTSPWLARLMVMNPLAWCTEAIRSALLTHPHPGALWASVGAACAAIVVALWVMARTPSET